MNTRLNAKQWILAALAVFVVVSILVFLFAKVSASLFPPTGTTAEQQPDIMMLRVWNYLSRFIYSLLLVVVFAKGYEGKSGLNEGLRFGVLMGLLIYLAGFFSNLVSSGATTEYLIFHAVEGIVISIIAGMTAGFVYARKPATPRVAS
jgi:hypothetical protein